MIRRYSLLVLVALCTGACEAWQPARTCDEVGARILRDIMQQPGSPEEVRAQIANAYGLLKEQVLMTSRADETNFRWTKDNVDFSVGIGGATPVEGGLYYNSRPPSVATVIDCLGAPDFYRAYYQRGGPEESTNILGLYLYFARRGVAAAAYVHGSGKEPPKLNMALPMQDFRFVPVLSIEDTMALLNENYSAEFRQQIKPWPGKLEDVVIGIEPGLSR